MPERSVQFCAEPSKVDRLRREAAELVDAFPLTVPALAARGFSFDAGTERGQERTDP